MGFTLFVYIASAAKDASNVLNNQSFHSNLRFTRKILIHLHLRDVFHISCCSRSLKPHFVPIRKKWDATFAFGSSEFYSDFMIYEGEVSELDRAYAKIWFHYALNHRIN